MWMTWTECVAVSPKRTKARIIAIVWVAISVRRFGRPSAISPPKRPRTRTGPNWAAATIPSQIGSPVSCRTSQPWATACIQVPMSETSWPTKKRR